MVELGKKDVAEFAEYLKSQYKLDFTDYAVSSFKRRLERILEVEQLEGLTQLKPKLMDKDYRDTFVNDVTVNTTEFFRDPLVWSKVREGVVQELGKKDSIKVLHAACSSGQEVYTMAIILKEMGLLDKAKIHALDLNPEMLEIAKSGKYPKRLLEESINNYTTGGGSIGFENYCTSDKFSIYMDTSLINGVQFKQSNLVTDDFFGDYDIIFIRNVLIYFNQKLQNTVLEKLNNLLKTDGYLVVGAKETIAWCSIASQYKTEFSKERIYRKS